MGNYYESDKKHFCGTYKGYRIYQVGCMIGSGWYGEFYAAKKVKRNYVKVRGSETSTLERLKAWVAAHPIEVTT